ncbi:hypothetical protein LINPERHAP1_LOCUS35232 [Linum perenne]
MEDNNLFTEEEVREYQLERLCSRKLNNQQPRLLLRTSYNNSSNPSQSHNHSRKLKLMSCNLFVRSTYILSTTICIMPRIITSNSVKILSSPTR